MLWRSGSKRWKNAESTECNQANTFISIGTVAFIGIWTSRDSLECNSCNIRVYTATRHPIRRVAINVMDRTDEQKVHW